MNVGPLHGMLRYATLVPSFQILKKKTAVYMSSRHYHNKWGLLMTKSCNDTRHIVEETSEKKSNTMETRVLNIYQEENKYVEKNVESSSRLTLVHHLSRIRWTRRKYRVSREAH
jgi:hypothetical protein